MQSNFMASKMSSFGSTSLIDAETVDFGVIGVVSPVAGGVDIAEFGVTREISSPQVSKAFLCLRFLLFFGGLLLFLSTKLDI
jgi:hypothetical protein